MVTTDRKLLPLALLLPAAILAPAPMWAQTADDQEDYEGEPAERYAQVRVLEGDATIRKGDLEEALDKSTPVGEGDVVESRGRGVLQLGDGTRIAFDAGSRFTVASLFMDRDGERMVRLRLDDGRIRVSVARGSETRVQVDAPVGQVSFGEKADVCLGVERQALEVKVFSTRASVRNQADRTTLGAGEWLRVNGPQESLERVRDFNTYQLDAFENWSGPRLAQRQGRDLERVPEEIRPYADELSGQGDWVYVDEIQTHCWRPRGVPQDWRPYWRGRWASYPGGMTWVSAEPWGFVTHHYGRWGWSLSLGWYWIPGIHYSPAWVAWQDSDAYFGWAPLGYYGAPCTWGYGAWAGGYCWNVVEINFILAPRIHHHMYAGWRNVRHFGPRGDRPLGAPWQRSPLMVRPGEMRDPQQFRRVVQQREIRRDRMLEYIRHAEQKTGRRIYRSTPQAGSRPGDATGRPQPQRGFVERERQLRRLERPEARPPHGGVAPSDRPQVRPQEGGPRERRTERQTLGGVVPPRGEQPRPTQRQETRPQEAEHRERRIERHSIGGVLPPRGEQPRPQEGQRQDAHPRDDRGAVAPQRREQPRDQESGDSDRRSEAPQRVQPPREREGRSEGAKEAPARSRELRPSRERREERPKGDR